MEIQYVFIVIFLYPVFLEWGKLTINNCLHIIDMSHGMYTPRISWIEGWTKSEMCHVLYSYQWYFRECKGIIAPSLRGLENSPWKLCQLSCLLPLYVQNLDIDCKGGTVPVTNNAKSSPQIICMSKSLALTVTERQLILIRNQNTYKTLLLTTQLCCLPHLINTEERRNKPEYVL